MSNTLIKQYLGDGFANIACYNTEGTHIFVGDQKSKCITKINIHSGIVEKRLEGFKGVVWDINISNNIMISCSGDFTICFWDLKTDTLIKNTNEDCLPKYVIQDDNNNSVIFCESKISKLKHYLAYYDNNFNLIRRIELDTKVSSLLWLTENIILIGCENGILMAYDIIQNKELSTTSLHKDNITSLTKSKKVNEILTASLDCSSKILKYNIQNNEIKFEEKLTINTETPINYAVYNYSEFKIMLGGGIESARVAKTANNDFALKLYKSTDGKFINSINLHNGPIRSIRNSHIDRTWVTVGQEGVVNIYFPDQSESNIDKNIYNAKPNDILSCFDLNGNKPVINTNNKISKKDGIYKPKSTINFNNNMYQPRSFNENSLKDNTTKKSFNDCSIKVTGLPNDTEYKDIKEMFEYYGRLKERGGINIKYYGINKDVFIVFVNYLNKESCDNAYNNLNGRPFNHSIITIEYMNKNN